MKKFILLFFFILLLRPCFVVAENSVEINTASLQQLDEITGIGPVLAQRIIDARPFSSVGDLLRVKGIGEKTLQKIKDQGLAYVEWQTQQPDQKIIQNTNPIPNPTPTPSPAIVPEITYTSGVFINEIMPNPEGPDETDEWVELYNSNNSDADLSGWQIQDTIGTITTYTVPQNTKILANSFSVFKRPDTKIMLNNDQDGLNLLTPDKKVADSVAFLSAPLNKSYNKTDGVPFGSWQWSLTLTPGAKNVVTTAPASNNIKTLPKAKNSVKNDGVEIGLAGLSQNIEKNQAVGNPWFLFFIVLATTIILAIIVLLIKFKFQKTHERSQSF